jgi:hypothetical protein
MSHHPKFLTQDSTQAGGACERFGQSGLWAEISLMMVLVVIVLALTWRYIW